MKTVLITGIYGFLGSHVALKYKQEGWNIVGLGRGTTLPDILKQVEVDQCVIGEVNKENLLKIKGSVDVVVHCAGNGVVSRSFEDPLKDFNDSIGCTAALLDFMRQYWPKSRCIFASGATVYGRQDDVLLREEMPLYPTSPYGIHKKITEELCEMYSNTFGLAVTVIRFFSLYGPGLQKQLLFDACKKLTDAETETATFWGTGDETRDWFSIYDAVELVYKAAAASEKFYLMNAGSGVKITLRETVDFIKKELNSSKGIVFTGQGRTGDPEHFWADIARAERLGWRPKISWREGIAEYVRWYKSRKDKDT